MPTRFIRTPLRGAHTTLVGRSPEGVLTILYTKLVPGTADQPDYAADPASRFVATAHTT